jgi:hypothetical protein
MLGWISLEAGAIDDRPFRGKTVQLCPVGAAQHMADEKTVPSQFRDDTHVQTVFGVCASIEVLDEVIAALHMRQHVTAQIGKSLWCHGRVVFPPDRIFNRWRADDKFILRRPSGILAGRDKKRPSDAQLSFVARNGSFDQSGFDQVVIDSAQPVKALIFKFLGWVYTSVVHLLQAPVADRCDKILQLGRPFSNEMTGRPRSRGRQFPYSTGF